MKIKIILLTSFLALSLSSFGQGTVSTVQGCHVQLQLPKRSAKTQIKKQQAIYNAPPHCIILSYKPNKRKALGPGDSSWSQTARGSRFISKSDMSQAFSDVLDLATSLNIKGEDLADLKFKLEQKHSNFDNTQNQIETSHATIIHNAQITGAGFGLAWDNGRTILETYADIKIKCFDDYLVNIIGLKNHLESYVKDYAKEIGVNDTSSTNINNPENKSKALSLPIIIIGIGVFAGLIIIIVIIIRKKR